MLITGKSLYADKQAANGLVSAILWRARLSTNICGDGAPVRAPNTIVLTESDNSR